MFVRKGMAVFALCVLLLTTVSGCTQKAKAKYGDGKCDVCLSRAATYDDGEREMCRDCFNSFIDWLDKQ